MAQSEVEQARTGHAWATFGALVVVILLLGLFMAAIFSSPNAFQQRWPPGFNLLEDVTRPTRAEAESLRRQALAIGNLPLANAFLQDAAGNAVPARKTYVLRRRFAALLVVGLGVGLGWLAGRYATAALEASDQDDRDLFALVGSVLGGLVGLVAVTGFVPGRSAFLFAAADKLRFGLHQVALLGITPIGIVLAMTALFLGPEAYSAARPLSVGASIMIAVAVGLVVARLYRAGQHRDINQLMVVGLVVALLFGQSIIDLLIADREHWTGWPVAIAAITVFGSVLWNFFWTRGDSWRSRRNALLLGRDGPNQQPEPSTILRAREILAGLYRMPADTLTAAQQANLQDILWRARIQLNELQRRYPAGPAINPVQALNERLNAIATAAGLDPNDPTVMPAVGVPPPPPAPAAGAAAAGGGAVPVVAVAAAAGGGAVVAVPPGAAAVAAPAPDPLEGVPETIAAMRPDDLITSRRYMNYVFNSMLGRQVEMDPNRVAEFRAYDLLLRQNAARLQDAVQTNNADQARQTYARTVDQLRGQLGRLQAIAPELDLARSDPPEPVALRIQPREAFREVTAAMLDVVELVDLKPPAVRMPLPQGQASQISPALGASRGPLTAGQLII